MALSGDQIGTVQGLGVGATGKWNAISSLNNWLKANILEAGQFTYQFLGEMDASIFPRVEVYEMSVGDLGFDSFGQNVFPAGGAGLKEGSLQQFFMIFDIYADKSDLELVRKIRDRLAWGLRMAGMSRDVDDSEILPPIRILDYNNSSIDTKTVAWVPIEEDNHMNEQYFPPSGETANLHQIRLVVKFKWWELNA